MNNSSMHNNNSSSVDSSLLQTIERHNARFQRNNVNFFDGDHRGAPSPKGASSKGAGKGGATPDAGAAAGGKKGVAGGEAGGKGAGGKGAPSAIQTSNITPPANAAGNVNNAVENKNNSLDSSNPNNTSGISNLPKFKPTLQDGLENAATAGGGNAGAVIGEDGLLRFGVSSNTAAIDPLPSYADYDNNFGEHQRLGAMWSQYGPKIIEYSRFQP
jgi:hypothetical protein